MTNRLYYSNSSLCQFSALIINRTSTDRGPAILLDQTAFYPTSGGQPHDTGTIDSIKVIDVWEDDNAMIWHLLEKMPLADDVIGRIDWERRFDHMQQHTGQHLLSATFLDTLNAQTVGFHLGRESSTIDLTIPSLEWKQAFQLEDTVNQVVWENREVNIHFVTQEELVNIPLRKQPQVSGKIRIICVEDYDASACGGTHVNQTGEIGIIKVTGFERYKGNVRLTFLCGQRALRDYQRTSLNLHQASADLSVHPDDLSNAISRLQEEAKTARRNLKKTRSELMQVEADRIWENTSEINGVRKIVAHWNDRSFADVRTVALKLRERPGTMLLLAATEENAVRLICARSDDLPQLDANAILHSATGVLGGRGGGSPKFAQGGAPLHSHEIIIDILMKAAQ